MVNIELPRRLPAGGGGRRAVAVPTVENVPAVGQRRDPGVSASPAAFGANMGAGLQEAAGGLSEVSDRLAVAGERIQKRRQAVNLSRSIRDFNEFTSAAVRDAETEQDLTDDAAVKAVSETIKAKREEIIGRFDTEDGRAAAEIRLSEIENSYLDSLSAKSVVQQRRLAGDVFGDLAKTRASAVAEDPSRLAEQVAGIESDMRDMAGAFTPDEERNLMDAEIANVALSAIGTTIRQGNFDEAEDILNSPEMARILPSQEWNKVADRIREARLGLEREHLATEQARLGVEGQQLATERARIGLEGERFQTERARIALERERTSGATSALLDETGAVKRETSGEIRRTTAQFLGGAYDATTDQVSGLNPDEARAAQALNSEVESILESGEENSIGQAVSLAVTRIELPEQLSFDDMADQAIAAIQDAEPTATELERAPEILQANKESLVDMRDATGLRSGLVDSIQNNILGQMDPRMVDTDVVAGRRKLALLENDFIASFKRSPRLPVWEQVRLSRIFSGPSVMRSPEGMKAELRVIDRLVTQEVEMQRRLLKAPIPVDQKQEILGNVLALTQFQKRVRDFEVNPALTDIKSVQDVQSASDGDIRSFLESRSDEEINQLPQSVRDAMFKKLGGEPVEDAGQGDAPVARSQADVDALAPGTEFLWQPSEDAEPIRMRREGADGGN